MDLELLIKFIDSYSYIVAIILLGLVIIEEFRIKNLKEKLNLYDPEKVLKEFKSMVEFKEEVKESMMKEMTENIKAAIKSKDKEKESMMKEMTEISERTINTFLKVIETVFNSYLNQSLLETRIETCNLIKEGADPNELIEDSEKMLNEL